MDFQPATSDRQPRATENTSNPAREPLKVDMADPKTREVLTVAYRNTDDSGNQKQSHEDRRQMMEGLIKPVEKVAELLQNGKLTAKDKSDLDSVLKYFAGGGESEVRDFVKKVNAQLKANGSDTRLATASIDPNNPNKLEVSMIDGDAHQTKLSPIDMKEPKAKRRAEDVADALSDGPELSKRNRITIENAFKEAYAEGGSKAVEDLQKKINAQLKEDKSDLRLVDGQTNIKSIFAKSFDVMNMKDASVKPGVDFDLQDPPRKASPRDSDTRGAQAPAPRYLNVTPLYG